MAPHTVLPNELNNERTTKCTTDRILTHPCHRPPVLKHDKVTITAEPRVEIAKSPLLPTPPRTHHPARAAPHCPPPPTRAHSAPTIPPYPQHPPESCRKHRDTEPPHQLRPTSCPHSSLSPATGPTIPSIQDSPTTKPPPPSSNATAQPPA
jgi:hypothetical protein